jgi:hypothetical protein
MAPIYAEKFYARCLEAKGYYRTTLQANTPPTPQANTPLVQQTVSLPTGATRTVQVWRTVGMVDWNTGTPPADQVVEQREMRQRQIRAVAPNGVITEYWENQP